MYRVDGSSMRGTRWEVSTTGVNPALQGVGGDPWKSPYDVGITIPAARPANGSRLLYLLAFARFGAHRKARLVGLRQLLTIGQNIATGSVSDPQNYPLELQVTSPFWKFVDGNVSWHLRRMPPGNPQTSHSANAEGLQFRYGMTPALLFEVPPSGLGGYSPPYGGLPPGNVLMPDLGTFHDMRFPWRDSQSWFGMDIEIQGPCDIVLFASVLQTQPGTRDVLTLPNTVPLTSLQPEDAFIANETAGQQGPAPNAVYRRIGGTLIFEDDNFYPIPRELREVA